MTKATFNFGANAKPKKAKAKAKKTKGGNSRKSNAWRQYVGVSNSPIPDY